MLADVRKYQMNIRICALKTNNGRLIILVDYKIIRLSLPSSNNRRTLHQPFECAHISDHIKRKPQAANIQSVKETNGHGRMHSVIENEC